VGTQIKALLKLATQRKTVREFKRAIPSVENIEEVLNTVCQAPSGSNMQPWRFMVIDDPKLKTGIRQAAEIGEKAFHEKLSEEKKNKYQTMGVSWQKPMLEQAPILIAVLSDRNSPNSKPSVWLAVGYLVLGLEAVGLGSVTYTPSDYKKVQAVLEVPDEFKLETILPIGYSNDSKVKGYRKPLEEVTYRNRWGEPLKR